MSSFVQVVISQNELKLLGSVEKYSPSQRFHGRKNEEWSRPVSRDPRYYKTHYTTQLGTSAEESSGKVNHLKY